ncbi:hypothetical protein M426DRAFT_11698 [Hypoxylon sp. CI-4A]|nr:hypothetical protein M426DRAFT_11698 [Hypoxylon sp. CI-4A]
MATSSSSSSSLILPPQTTPFAPPPGSDCALSVYCRYLNYWDYQSRSDEHSMSNMPCQAVNVHSVLDSASESGQESRYRTEPWYNTDCFPEGYTDLFRSMNAEVPFDVPMDALGASTLAYPGTECLSGWSTACTTTMTAGGSEYPEAWCCPQDYTCATKEGIAMSWNPPFTDDGGQTYTAWTAGVSSEDDAEFAATVFHRVFPLQLTMSTSDSAQTQLTTTGENTTDFPTESGSNGSSTNQSNSSDTSSSHSSSLSTGAIAGITIGAVVFLGILFCLFLFYRKENKAQKQYRAAMAAKSKKIGSPPSPSSRAPRRTPGA